MSDRPKLNRRTGLPKYCTFQYDRHGRRRIRFRTSGFTAQINEEPNSNEFWLAYNAALEGVKQQREQIGATRTRPGSMNTLIAQYYRSPEFTKLRDASRRTYRGILERFRIEHGDRLVRDIQRKHLKAIIGGMSDRPQAANNLLARLAHLLEFAIDIGMAEANPARGMKGYPKKTPGHHTWTEEEIAQYRRRHEIGTMARLALELLLHSAQRRGDVIRIGPQHIRGGWLDITQRKTGARVEIPVHPTLNEAKEAMGKTGQLVYLQTSHGNPFSDAGFGNWFRKRCNEAGLPHCSAHGLRKAAGTRLADAGASHEQIKSVTGHQTDKEASKYTAMANKRRLAEQAQALVNDAPEGEPGTKIGEPSKRVRQKHS